MIDMEKVINDLKELHGSKETMELLSDVIALLKEQEEIKEQFIEAFNTIRDAYNAPTNREKILLNYLMRNACCCEQKCAIYGEKM